MPKSQDSFENADEPVYAHEDWVRVLTGAAAGASAHVQWRPGRRGKWHSEPGLTFELAADGDALDHDEATVAANDIATWLHNNHDRPDGKRCDYRIILHADDGQRSSKACTLGPPPANAGAAHAPAQVDPVRAASADGLNAFMGGLGPFLSRVTDALSSSQIGALNTTTTAVEMGARHLAQLEKFVSGENMLRLESRRLAADAAKIRIKGETRLRLIKELTGTFDKYSDEAKEIAMHFVANQKMQLALQTLLAFCAELEKRDPESVPPGVSALLEEYAS